MTEWDVESILARHHEICACAQLTQWQLFETGKPTEWLELVTELVNLSMSRSLTLKGSVASLLISF